MDHLRYVVNNKVRGGRIGMGEMITYKMICFYTINN